MREIIRERLKAIGDRVSEANLMELTELVWQTDRQSSISSYHATYRHVSAKLREWNIRARPFDAPADGHSVFGDWKMSTGWDCQSALLEVIDPFELRHKILAERKKRPQAVVAYSGSTPNGGITAVAIRIRDEAELDSKKSQIKGKLVYTIMEPRSAKMRLMAAGAVGIISSWSPAERYMPDATASIDSWSNDIGYGGFHEGDAAFPAMMVSPEMGVELDVLFDRGSVRLRMVIDAKFEATAALPVTCGYIDATLQEEIVAVCSTQRQGANACATGAAVALEAMRAIQAGATAGDIPPLKRAIRALLTSRGYGTIGFAARNPGILRRAVAALNLDSVGRYQEQASASLKRYFCPDAVPSITDTLLSVLLEEHLGTALPYAHVKSAPFGFVDNGYNDPLIGVPTPAIRGTDRLAGTSADTADNHISTKSLKAFATIAGAYMHILSTCTQKEACWLAHETVRRYGTRIENAAADCAGALHLATSEDAKKAAMAKAIDRMDYIKEISEKAVMSAKNFMLREERASGHLILMKYCRHLRRLVDLEKRRLKELADCDAGEIAPVKVDADLAGVRPYKKFIGTATYESIPAAERHDEHGPIPNPREDGVLHAATFWANGHHTFEEIARAITHEFEHVPSADIWRHFRFMEKHGLMLLLKAGEAVPKPPKPASLDKSSPEAERPADAENTAEATDSEAPVDAPQDEAPIEAEAEHEEAAAE